MVLKILDNWAKLVTIVWRNQNLKNSSRPCGKIVLLIVKPIFFFSCKIDSIYCLTLLIYFKEATVLARRELGQKICRVVELNFCCSQEPQQLSW